MRVMSITGLCVGVALLLAGCGPSGGGASSQAPAPTEAGPSPAAKAALASLPAPYSGADLANGQEKFNQCRACHTAEKDAPNMTGPNLWGVFGRKAGSLPGFQYSESLKSTGITWDAAAIDKWITNPRAVAPDTRMSLVGVSNAKDRVDIVGYLRTLSSNAQ